MPARTACQRVVDFDFDREAQATTPSVNGSGIQVFTGLPTSQAHMWNLRGLFKGVICSESSGSKQTAIYLVKYSKLGFDMTINIIRQTVCL